MLKYPSVKPKEGEAVAEEFTEEQIKINEEFVTEDHKQFVTEDHKPKINWLDKYGISETAPHGIEEIYGRHFYALKWRDFLCIAFCLEMPLTHIAQLVDLTLRWGGRMIFMGYSLFAMGLSIPLLMLLLFLGSYIKKGYIRVWEMVPIFKGMAWTVSLFSIALELFNVAMAGLALTYLMHLFNVEVPWKDCNFEEATEKCYTTYPNSTNGSCKKLEDMLHYPAFDFLLKHMLDAPDSYKDVTNIGKLEGEWVMHLFISWMVIFVLASLGFRKFQTLMTSIFLILCALLVPIIISTIGLSTQYPMTSIMVSNYQSMINVNFWIDIMLHSFSRELPGNFVFLGSIAPIDMLPNVDAYKIYGLKFLFAIILMMWLSLGVRMVQDRYKIPDAKCIPVNGFTLIFAIIPDIFLQIPLPQFPLTFYFFGVWFLGISSAVYTLSAFIDSLIEEYPIIKRFRVSFTAVLCITSFCCNMSLTTSCYFMLEETWTEIIYPIITCTLALLFSVAIFIYSTENIAYDFQFTYGKPLSNYWISCFKLTALITFFLFTFILSENMEPKWKYGSNTVVMVLSILFVIIVLTPTLSIATLTYLKFKNRGEAGEALTPTMYWGPLNTAKKEARSKYNPQKEVRYKMEGHICKHHCLLYSKKLKMEHRLLARNRIRLHEIIIREKEQHEFEL